MNYSGVRTLVTGADGFIGSHLVEALIESGARVTALAQYNAFGHAGWLDEIRDDLRDQIEIVRGDIRDPSLVHRIVDTRDIVFHLAALIAIPYSYEAPYSYVDVNVTGTLNVLEAARAQPNTRVIHTSTSEVYGSALFRPITEAHPLQGQSPYSASKIGADMMAEAYARSFDLPVSILRPFNTFGPRQSERAVIPTIIRQALDPACDSINLGDLSTTRDFNYVDNTVRAFLALGNTADVEMGTAYNAGTGVEVTIGHVLDRIQALTGANKPTHQESARLRPARSEVRALIADSSRLENATGWTAGISLDQGLEQTIDWWRERIAQGALRKDTEYLR